MSITWRKIKDTVVDVGLVAGVITCVVLLFLLSGMVMLYVCLGLCFCIAGAYTVVRGQAAENTTEKYLWYLATGLTAFLFLYWSLNYVFRAPRNQNTVGCGGVQFIHH